MNLSFQEFLFSIMQFSIGKKILKKINSKTGFQNRKPDFGLKTENRISGFRLTSLISTNHSNPSALVQLTERSWAFMCKRVQVVCIALYKRLPNSYMYIASVRVRLFSFTY